MQLLLIVQNKQSIFRSTRIATREDGMNHDPQRFCFECRKMKPTKGFRPLSRGPGSPRWACAECFDKVEAIRKERHAQAVISAGRDST